MLIKRVARNRAYRFLLLFILILFIFGQQCKLSNKEPEDWSYPPAKAKMEPSAAAYGDGYFAIVGDVEWYIPPEGYGAEQCYGGACAFWVPNVLSAPRGFDYSGFLCVCDDSFSEAQVGFPVEGFLQRDFTNSYSPHRVLPRIETVCYGEGKFLALGYGTSYGAYEDVWSYLWVFDVNNLGFDKNDPSNGWILSELRCSDPITTIVYGGGQFLAVTWDGYLLSSPDASPGSWTYQYGCIPIGTSHLTLPGPSYPWLAFGDGRWVAVSDSKVAWCHDPVEGDWTVYDTPELLGNRIAYSCDRFVVVGSGGCWRSPDGSEGTWERTNLGEVNPICCYVIPGSTSSIIISATYDANTNTFNPEWWYAGEDDATIIRINQFPADNDININQHWYFRDWNAWNHAIAYGNNMFISFSSAEYDLTSTAGFSAHDLVARSLDGSPGSWAYIDPEPELIIPTQ